MIDALQAVENALSLIAEMDSDASFHYRRNFLRCRVAETLSFLQERSKALDLIKSVQEACDQIDFDMPGSKGWNEYCWKCCMELRNHGPGLRGDTWFCECLFALDCEDE